mmetsp:Transcript_13430/g.25289  ORF Transcript_13430/g.25289 Transcript_13430/m.25289 type:complete len:177 (+) Transcript_13430:444-974(+)
MLARAIRTSSRGFKSWTEYKAEQNELPVQEYLDATRRPDGAYAKWRSQQQNEARLNYILDHCKEEEAKRHLAEFSPEDLAQYIQDHLHEMPGEQVYLFLKRLKPKYSKFPVINWILKNTKGTIDALSQVTTSVTPDGLLHKVASKVIKQTLTQRFWEKVDSEAAKKFSNTAVAKGE